MADSAESTNAAGKGPLSKPKRFVWPPALREWNREDATESSATHRGEVGELARADSIDASASTPIGWWEHIERTYLGVTSMPWQRRVHVAGFAADNTDAWCFRCGRSVGAYEVVTEGPDAGCKGCRGSRLPWRRVVRLAAYRGVMRSAILEIKNSAFRALASDVGRDLGTQLTTCLAYEGLTPADALLVPVPTSMWRRLRRGIDHPLAIARGVRAQTGMPIEQLLARQHRPMQTGSSLETRRKNVAGSMHIAWRWRQERLPAPKVVVLLDDVMTTGATMREAARVLRDAWRAQARAEDEAATPEIWIAVLGVTPEKAEPAEKDGV